MIIDQDRRAQPGQRRDPRPLKGHERRWLIPRSRPMPMPGHRQHAHAFGALWHIIKTLHEPRIAFRERWPVSVASATASLRTKGHGTALSSSSITGHFTTGGDRRCAQAVPRLRRVARSSPFVSKPHRHITSEGRCSTTFFTSFNDARYGDRGRCLCGGEAHIPLFRLLLIATGCVTQG